VVKLVRANGSGDHFLEPWSAYVVIASNRVIRNLSVADRLGYLAKALPLLGVRSIRYEISCLEYEAWVQSNGARNGLFVDVMMSARVPIGDEAECICGGGPICCGRD